MSLSFEAIAGRLAAREPLTADQVAWLWESRNLIALGMLAEQERRRAHGDRVTFLRVHPVDRESLDSAVSPAAGEVRIVAPAGAAGEAVRIVRQTKERAGRAPLSGYSLADLERLAGSSGPRLDELLRELRGAGLDLIAEAPVDRVGDEAIAAAGRLGVPIERFTTEQDPGRDLPALIDRVGRLRSVTPARLVFAPLPRRVTPQPTTGYDDVRAVALARILLPAVDSLQVDWTLYGPKLCQVALSFGADDLDSVPAVESVDLGRRRTPLEEVTRNIRSAGLVPVERTGLWQEPGA